jgi:hypothetical protein
VAPPGLLLIFLLTGSPSQSTNARVERGPSEGARSASRRTTWLPDPLYFTRNGFEFSPEAVVTLRRTKPFVPPVGTVVVILSLV